MKHSEFVKVAFGPKLRAQFKSWNPFKLKPLESSAVDARRSLRHIQGDPETFKHKLVRDPKLLGYDPTELALFKEGKIPYKEGMMLPEKTPAGVYYPDRHQVVLYDKTPSTRRHEIAHMLQTHAPGKRGRLYDMAAKNDGKFSTGLVRSLSEIQAEAVGEKSLPRALDFWAHNWRGYADRAAENSVRQTRLGQMITRLPYRLTGAPLEIADAFFPLSRRK